jgi:hypothetical protein
MNQRPSPNSRPDLRQLVQDAVAAYSLRQTGAMKRLVEVGLERNMSVTLEDYSLMLLEAGLPPWRTSEVKGILTFEDVAERLVGWSGEPLSYRKAVKESRALLAAQKGKMPRTTPETPASEAAQRAIIKALEALLKAKPGPGAWDLTCGIYHLEFTPSQTGAEPSPGFTPSQNPVAPQQEFTPSQTVETLS